MTSDRVGASGKAGDNLWILDAEGGNAKQVTNETFRLLCSPVWSPDGRYLYYSQDVTPGDTFQYDKDSHRGIYAIKRLDLIDGTTEVLIRGPGGACQPTPSPDGRSLASAGAEPADTDNCPGCARTGKCGASCRAG